MQCTHNAVGCGWKGPRRDLASHVECCAYEKIKGLVPRVSASLKQMHTQVRQHYIPDSISRGLLARRNHGIDCDVLNVQYKQMSLLPGEMHAVSVSLSTT